MLSKFFNIPDMSQEYNDLTNEGFYGISNIRTLKDLALDSRSIPLIS